MAVKPEKDQGLLLAQREAQKRRRAHEATIAAKIIAQNRAAEAAEQALLLPEAAAEAPPAAPPKEEPPSRELKVEPGEEDPGSARHPQEAGPGVRAMFPAPPGPGVSSLESPWSVPLNGDEAWHTGEEAHQQQPQQQQQQQQQDESSVPPDAREEAGEGLPVVEVPNDEAPALVEVAPLIHVERRRNGREIMFAELVQT